MTDVKIGKVDLAPEYDYMIVYIGDDGAVNTWTLPEGSFQHNYKSMRSRGVKILNVYHRMGNDDLLEAMCKGN